MAVTSANWRVGRLRRLAVRTAPAIGFVICIAGCQSDRTRPEAHEAPAWTEEGCPALGPPTLRIGSAEGPVAFSSVSAIVPMPGTGEVLVLDPTAGEARLFDGSGSPVRAVGRAGQGPGEFGRGPWMGAGLLGDSFWIHDPVLRRTSVFSVESDLQRTVSVPVGTIVEGSFTVTGAVPITADHWLAILSWDGSPISVPVVLLDGSGQRPRVAAWLRPDDSPRALLEVPGRGAITTVPPIRFRALSTVTRGEAAVVVVEASRDELTYEMRWIDPESATVVARYSGRYDPVPIPREERERQVTLVVEQLSRVAVLSPRQVEEAFAFPDHYPPFERILPGLSEDAWLERAGPPGVSRWERFDQEGPTGCGMALDSRERPMFVDADGIWLRETDSLGVATAVFRPWIPDE